MLALTSRLTVSIQVGISRSGRSAAGRLGRLGSAAASRRPASGRGPAARPPSGRLPRERCRIRSASSSSSKSSSNSGARKASATGASGSAVVASSDRPPRPRPRRPRRRRGRAARSSSPGAATSATSSSKPSPKPSNRSSSGVSPVTSRNSPPRGSSCLGGRRVDRDAARSPLSIGWGRPDDSRPESGSRPETSRPEVSRAGRSRRSLVGEASRRGPRSSVESRLGARRSEGSLAGESAVLPISPLSATGSRFSPEINWRWPRRRERRRLGISWSSAGSRKSAPELVPSSVSRELMGGTKSRSSNSATGSRVGSGRPPRGASKLRRSAAGSLASVGPPRR